jgi:O-antigen/teichoic acid export membrane protein
MKKNGFMEGSFIATFGIVLCKIIGLIYVIPFYAMISNTGAALYSYAYSIYAVFLSLSTSGIPIAMSKLVSEYNSLEYYYTKEKIYKLGNRLIMSLGIFFCIILMLFAPSIASFILGKATGGNTVEDVTFVIRIVATALLVVPSLSVIKGYYQGHKFITPPSISNVIEQLIRVLVILVGCFISLKVMGLKESVAIAISVFAATIGALFAYLYLYFKWKKNKRDFHTNEPMTREEAKFTTKYLIKQILLLSIPFIVIDVLKSSYNLVDTLTVVRTLTDLGYPSDVAETAFSVIGTWGSKLSMIIISISMGISTSLIPNIASDFIQKKQTSLNHKINQAIQTLLFFTIPMTFGIFFLARPVWIIFYGYNAFSIEVFRIFIIQSITFSLITILINITQTTNKNKVAMMVLLTSFIANAILNIPMMYFCEYIGFGGYQGASVATLITQIIPCIFLLIYLKKYLHLDYTSSKKNVLEIILATAIMFLSMMILELFIPLSSVSRIKAILEVILYTLFGGSIYLFLLHKCGLLKELFGNNLLKKFYKTHA